MNRMVFGVVLAIIAVAIIGATTALLSSPGTPTQESPVLTVGVDVYTDPQSTILCNDIDWGTLDEGDNATKIVYVKNTGNTTEILHMYTSGWMPVIAESLMTLSWDQEGATLQPEEIVAATLTLSTSWDMDDVDAFDFNLIIEGLA